MQDASTVKQSDSLCGCTDTADYSIAWRHFRLELGRQTRTMGIVNVTPDSFSDGGHFFDCDAAVAHAQKLVAEGADIIDIGGESTRPFSEPLRTEDEIRRVMPVIEKLSGQISVPISIDTTKAAVAETALQAGAAMINDISALRQDPEMARIVAAYEVPVVIMHMKGIPKTMQVSPDYDDLFGEIRSFLSEAIDYAVNRGIRRRNIIVDPGIGFGKTFEHNLALLNGLHRFKALDMPILIGPSRKAFIRNLLKKPGRQDLDPQLPCVETGTQAAVAAGVLKGAHIVRVHDVASTRSTLKLVDAIRNAHIPQQHKKQ
jgi:dihydropteroate synthase